MGTTDRILRSGAQPFLGQIFDYNRNEQSDQTADNATRLGDLQQLANGFTNYPALYAASAVPQQDNMIRILRPKSGNIIDAHLTIALRTATAETNPYFKLSVYKVTSSTDFTRLTPSEAIINACMIKLTGATTPFTNTAGQVINIDALSIISLIPQSGDTDYIEDCFTIGVHFYTSAGLRATPSSGSGYKLTKFAVEMSALVY